MNLSDFHFAEPRWLWVAAVAPLLLALLHRHAAHARREQLARMASPHFVEQLTVSHSPARRRFKEILLLAVLALAGLALARPQWGRVEAGNVWLGEDVVFLLDCSLSMTTSDVLPNRMQRAKFAMIDFVRRQSHGRVGLVPFAGSAFIQCPLTFDVDAFEETLLAVDEKTIPIPGTDIGRALNEAYHAMDKGSRRKMVVLLTDGEDLEKSGIAAAKRLATNGVVVFAIGVGTPEGKEVSTVNAAGQLELVRDAKGEIVHSRLDEATLREIARVTGGGYYSLGALGEGLTKIGPAIQALESAGGLQHSAKNGVDRFYWLIGLMLSLLIAESLLGTRREKQSSHVMKRFTTINNRWLQKKLAPRIAEVKSGGQPPQSRRFAIFSAGWLARSVWTACASAPLFVAGQSGSVMAGNFCKKSGWVFLIILTISLRAVADDGTNLSAPVTARDFYNAGTKLLAAEKFTDAERMFQTALAAQEERVQPPALYNLGHTRFADGVELLKKGPDAQKVSAQGEAALAAGEHAIHQSESALAENNLEKMISAYLEGRGARRNLRDAEKAVQAAMETYGKTLTKWRRAADDFKGAAELNPADTNASHNAEVVERSIAKLVDSLRKMQEMAGMMGKQKQQLGQLLSKLKGQIPAPNAPPGAAGEEDEEEEGAKPDSLAGQKENAARQGDEMKVPLSPDQAGQILDGLSLDGTRRLSMSDKEGAKPKDKNGRNW